MKCISSCFSCLCGSKSSARVTPSDPRQIVCTNATKPNCRYRRSTEEDDNGSGGRVNPNFSIGEGEDDPCSTREGHPPGVKALYIEVGKERLLRVIHVRNVEDGDGTASRKASMDGSTIDLKKCPSEHANSSVSLYKSPAGNNEETNAGGDDDEEEYWFSKWARKPRFRSIFAKNPENRPKLGNESNNNMSQDDSNKVNAELEMARAAAAAKRRAWAYNNNGNCEPTITQQPTVNMGDEEEFNSIAIVNSTKQQWTKQGTSGETQEDDEQANTSISSSKVQVEVSVESHSGKGTSPMVSASKDGISNPAFQEDEEDDEYDNCETDKTEQNTQTKGQNALTNLRRTTNNDQNTSMASSSSSGKSPSPSTHSAASTQEAEDEITTEEPSPAETKSISPASRTSSLPSYYTPPSGDPVLNITPKKPILFFIHSVAGSSDVWHHQFEFFQQLGYEIVAPDLLGHGLSSTPLNPKYYFFESLVQDLILIFDHFCKEEDTKVVLIGHGYGACLAAMLTRVRLKNVALFISIAGGGPTPLVRRTCCQDSWLSWKCRLFHSNRIRGRFDNPELRHVLPATIYENLLSGQIWQDGDSSFYRRITVPTLLTYGMRDKVVTLVEECEMERTIPKSFLELIDSAGHMVMLDEPEKLNKMLCKFIQSWS